MVDFLNNCLLEHPVVDLGFGADLTLRLLSLPRGLNAAATSQPNGDAQSLEHSRLRRIVTCIGPNQKNQPNLDLYLDRRYKICHFPIVVSYLCIGQNGKNQPNLVLYLVRRSKTVVSIATLLTC